MSENTKQDGGPAFGQVVELRCVRVDMDGSTEWEPEAMVHGGLTVRDYFAAKAMPNLIGLCMDGDGAWSADNVAQCAYNLADAMIAARNLEKP